jgi:hypothetical protein
MTFANMYEQGVHQLIAFCHNDARRHSEEARYQPEPEDHKQAAKR